MTHKGTSKKEHDNLHYQIYVYTRNISFLASVNYNSMVGINKSVIIKNVERLFKAFTDHESLFCNTYFYM